MFNCYVVGVRLGHACLHRELLHFDLKPVVHIREFIDGPNWCSNFTF